MPKVETRKAFVSGLSDSIPGMPPRRPSLAEVVARIEEIKDRERKRHRYLATRQAEGTRAADEEAA